MTDSVEGFTYLLTLGQQKLLGNPQVILADEITSTIDEKDGNRATIWPRD